MYVKINNNVVTKLPYTMGDLHKEHPNTSFPNVPSDEMLASFGMFKVKEVQAPTVDSKTHRQIQTVELVNGEWSQVWTVQKLPEDKASDNVRGKRNQLLSDSDWTQVLDAPVNKEAWAEYRQALRDLPDQAGFPFDVVYPDAP